MYGIIGYSSISGVQLKISVPFGPRLNPRSESLVAPLCALGRCLASSEPPSPVSGVAPLSPLLGHLRHKGTLNK